MGREVVFRSPRADTGRIITELIRILPELLGSEPPGYYRAGVTLYDFVPDGFLQTDLLGDVQPAKHDAATARMVAIDSLNERFGKGRVRYAAQDLGSTWEPRQKLRSPRYLSHWPELPHIKPL